MYWDTNHEEIRDMLVPQCLLSAKATAKAKTTRRASMVPTPERSDESDNAGGNAPIVSDHSDSIGIGSADTGPIGSENQHGGDLLPAGDVAGAGFGAGEDLD